MKLTDAADELASAVRGDHSSTTKWRDLERWQQVGIVGLAAAEIVTTTVALVDIVRRPRPQVRGPKVLWALGCAVQPFGPVAYLALGRRRG
ncbi:PLD nuclease N-terminal domain-containing protein [Mangrovihabitans endophyticus]|uniref:Cardiolipin synthase N-terminal domain-containing protein n=1 Tax=Mangrovihabitans endophyticus TaxID=1751298 RepID=A0A8J3C811_9ACTN|nr:PLD nuclease N-terminal domain-containing protein [Mangrovihabitans endophyticus]GGL16879.1 hypothetical protein GCM10012284_59310 [Mangrovihabitans endophyticus]